MRPYLYLFVLSLALVSCGGKNEENKKATATVPAVLTTNEQTAVKQITNFYGGTCNLTTGETKQGSKRFARLEMSKSTALDSAVNITELSLANIALVFYKDLEAERNNFDEIQTSIMFDSIQKVERAYPVAQLD